MEVDLAVEHVAGCKKDLGASRRSERRASYEADLDSILRETVHGGFGVTDVVEDVVEVAEVRFIGEVLDHEVDDLVVAGGRVVEAARFGEP